MPTYDYECAACDHKWELFQSITADPIKKCPKCRKSKARRLIGTGSSILFKGSGFYITDYRSDSYKQAAKADSEASSGKKSETRPAESSNTPSTPASTPPPKSESSKSSKKKSA